MAFPRTRATRRQKTGIPATGVSFQVELESVVSDADTRRQLRFGRLGQFVGDMSEESPFRSDFCRDPKSLRHTKVCRMRFVPESINDQNLYPGDFFDDRIRDGAAIAEIGDKLP